MDEFWIEPKMIEFGNDEMNKAQKSLDNKSEEKSKSKDDILGQDR